MRMNSSHKSSFPSVHRTSTSSFRVHHILFPVFKDLILFWPQAVGNSLVELLNRHCLQTFRSTFHSYKIMPSSILYLRIYMSLSMVIFKLNFSYPLQLTWEITLQLIKMSYFLFPFPFPSPFPFPFPIPTNHNFITVSHSLGSFFSFINFTQSFPIPRYLTYTCL